MFVDDLMFEMIKVSPFYARMFRACKVTIDNKMEYPACVFVKHGIQMKLNLDYMKNMSVETQVGIIEHEFQHLFKEHVTQGNQKTHETYAGKIGMKGSHMAYNIAIDAEINPQIKGIKYDKEGGQQAVKDMRNAQEQLKNKVKNKLSEEKIKEYEDYIEEHGESRTFVFPESFGMSEGRAWPEYYLKILEDNPEMDGKDLSKAMGLGEGDEEGPGGAKDHDYFNQSIQDQEIFDKIVANTTEKVVSTMKNVGNIPVEVTKYIEDVKKRTTLPWSLLLRQFVQSLLSEEKETSWKRSNRRFPEDRPGHKRKPKLKILLGLDASGSVNDDEWAEFATEIKAIWNENVELHVAEFDCEIGNYYKFKGKLEPRSTHGGTDFRPVHDLCLKDGYKGLIMLTDGYGPYADKADVTYRSLWVMNNKREKAPYGQTVALIGSKSNQW